MAANSFVAEERQAIAAGKQLMQVSVAAFEIRGRKRRSKHDSHDAALYQREGNDISLFQLRSSAAAAMLGPEEPRSVGTTSDGARACWLCVQVSSDMSSAARPGLFQLLLWSNSWGKSWPGTDRGSGSVMWSRTAAQTETEPRVSSEWRDETMQNWTLWEPLHKDKCLHNEHKEDLSLCNWHLRPCEQTSGHLHWLFIPSSLIYLLKCSSNVAQQFQANTVFLMPN